MMEGGSMADLPKLVHIDMKGGPPRPSYLMQVTSLVYWLLPMAPAPTTPLLLQLLPLLKNWGASGLLLEWEDMFPWQVSLIFHPLSPFSLFHLPFPGRPFPPGQARPLDPG